LTPLFLLLKRGEKAGAPAQAVPTISFRERRSRLEGGGGKGEAHTLLLIAGLEEERGEPGKPGPCPRRSLTMGGRRRRIGNSIWCDLKKGGEGKPNWPFKLEESDAQDGERKRKSRERRVAHHPGEGNSRGGLSSSAPSFCQGDARKKRTDPGTSFCQAWAIGKKGGIGLPSDSESGPGKRNTATRLRKRRRKGKREKEAAHHPLAVGGIKTAHDGRRTPEKKGTEMRFHSCHGEKRGGVK